MKIELIKIIDEEFVIKERIQYDIERKILKDSQIDRYPYTAVVKIDDGVKRRLGCYYPDKNSTDTGNQNLKTEIQRQLDIGEKKLYLPYVYLPKLNLSKDMLQQEYNFDESFYLNLMHSIVDNTNFSSATFGDNNDFISAIFGDNTDFSSAIFGDNTDFSFAIFGDNTDFSSATFGDNNDFMYATFGDNNDFMYATFRDKTNFIFATFGDNNDFRSATFGDKTYFIGATFEDNTYFSYTNFLGSINFRDSVAKGISFRDSIVKDYLYLGEVKHESKDTVMEWIDLTDMKVHGFLYPSSNVDFKKEFAPCVWANKDEDGNKDLEATKETFLVLKQAYNKTGRFKEEDLAYVEFKRAERDFEYQTPDKESRPDELKRMWNYFVSKQLFDRVGEYGTNPGKVLVTMGVVYILFSVLFLFFTILGNTFYPNMIPVGGNEEKPKTQTVNVINFKSSENNLPIFFERVDSFIPEKMKLRTMITRSFYHSGITFLTIGYGDLRPCNGLGIVLSILEGFCGLFLMSYLTIAFSRKVLR